MLTQSYFNCTFNYQFQFNYKYSNYQFELNCNALLPFKFKLFQKFSFRSCSDCAEILFEMNTDKRYNSIQESFTNGLTMITGTRTIKYLTTITSNRA